MTYLEISVYVVGGIAIGIITAIALPVINRRRFRAGHREDEFNPRAAAWMASVFALDDYLRALTSETHRVKKWEDAGGMLIVAAGAAFGCGLVEARRHPR